MKSQSKSNTVFLQIIAHRQRQRTRAGMFAFQKCSLNDATMGYEVSPLLKLDFDKSRWLGKISVEEVEMSAEDAGGSKYDLAVTKT